MLQWKADRRVFYALICIAALAAAGRRMRTIAPRTASRKSHRTPTGCWRRSTRTACLTNERIKLPTTKAELAGIRITGCRENSNGREIYKLKLKTGEVWVLARAIDLKPPPVITCSDSTREPGKQSADRNVDVGCHNERR